MSPMPDYEHDVYADPVEGGWRWYAPTCRTCGWRGDVVETKEMAQRDAKQHRDTQPAPVLQEETGTRELVARAIATADDCGWAFDDFEGDDELLAKAESNRAHYIVLADAVLAAVSLPSGDGERGVLRDAAENAVQACLGLLPISGSEESGYRVGERIQLKVLANEHEWADAAQAICDLHRVASASGAAERFAAGDGQLDEVDAGLPFAVSGDREPDVDHRSEPVAGDALTAPVLATEGSEARLASDAACDADGEVVADRFEGGSVHRRSLADEGKPAAASPSGETGG